MVAAGSNIRPMRSARVPSELDIDANRSGSVVRMLTHQTGRTAIPAIVRMVRAGGMVSPFRTSRIRAPATGVSTVSTNASYSARIARSISATLASRSFHR